jgi:hypothetical protein
MDYPLVNPISPGVPAPFWFVQFFKVLGFSLHLVPMNLWYAGLLIALMLHLRGGEHGRRFGARLLQQMPILIAFGINFGIVPLLFVQLAYYKVFYPATILMAWFWLSIIFLLIPAYYGVYVYAWALRKDTHNSSRYAESGRRAGGRDDKTPPGIPLWKQLAGWLAALLFLVIAFLFVNAMSLAEHVQRWPELWSGNQVAGAALGTALNVGDATFWPRWLLMFGLALGTTATWLVVDAAWLTVGASEAYHRWAWAFAKKLYTVGLIWFAVAGTWYVFGTWSHDLRSTMFQFPTILLTILTAMAPGLPWLLILTADWCDAKRATAAAVGVAQFGVLGINAISRQVVQNVNLKPFLDVAAQPTDVQWGPLAMFLIAFVLGVGVIAWMLVQAVAAARSHRA